MSMWINNVKYFLHEIKVNPKLLCHCLKDMRYNYLKNIKYIYPKQDEEMLSNVDKNVVQKHLLHDMAYLLNIQGYQTLENTFEEDVLNTVNQYINSYQTKNNMQKLKKLVNAKKTHYKNLNKSMNPIKSLTSMATLSKSFTKNEMKKLLKNKSSKSSTYRKLQSVVLEKACEVLSDYENKNENDQ